MSESIMSLVIEDLNKNIFHPIVKEIYEKLWFYTELNDININTDDVHDLLYDDYKIFKLVLAILARLDVKINDEYVEVIKREINNIEECLTLNVGLSAQHLIESVHSVSYNVIFKTYFPNTDADELLSKLPSLDCLLKMKSNNIVDCLVLAYLIEGIIIPLAFNFMFTLKFCRKVYSKTHCEAVCQLNSIIVKDEAIHRDLLFLIIRTYFPHLIDEVYSVILSNRDLMINIVDNMLCGNSNFAGTDRSEFIYLIDRLIEIFKLSFVESRFPTTFSLEGTVLDNLVNDSLSYTKQFEAMNANYSKNDKFKMSNTFIKSVLIGK